MTYTATAALPFPDAHRAVSGLREQLRLLISTDGQIPDWATLRVTEPVQVIGQHGRVWYEWTATVSAGDQDAHAK
jgi:hypothetical protein